MFHVEEPLECGSSYPVIDLSEQGVRYLAQGDALEAGAVVLPSVGQQVRGRLLPEGEREGATGVPLRGRVLRVQDGEVALHFGAATLPLAVVMSEQRRVLARARHAL